MSDLSLRDKLNAVVEQGREAERALEKLSVLEQAESQDATVDDLRQATAVAEGEADFETACRLKDRWIKLLKRGAR
jgi:hypothetical protein